MVYHYWYFNDGFKFQNSVCNGCHDLFMLTFKISDITDITVIHGIRKFDGIHLLENLLIY